MSKQKTIELGVEIYRLVKILPPEEEHVLAEMLMHASGEIAANFSMGSESNLEERNKFFSVARGKIAVVETLLSICVELKYFGKEEIGAAVNLCAELRKVLIEP